MIRALDAAKKGAFTGENGSQGAGELTLFAPLHRFGLEPGIYRQLPPLTPQTVAAGQLAEPRAMDVGTAECLDALSAKELTSTKERKMKREQRANPMALWKVDD